MSHVIPIAVSPREPLGSDLLVVGCFEGESPDLAGLAGAVKEAAEGVARRPGFQGKEEQTAETAVPGSDSSDPSDPAGVAVVAVHGLGKRAELTWRKLATWLQKAADSARLNGVARLAFLLPRHPQIDGRAAAERIARCLALAGYCYDRFLSDAAAKPGRIERVTVLPPSGGEADFQAALAVTAPLAGAVALARDLANTPANEATPAWLEAQARELAAAKGLEIAVLDADELARRGMGGLLAVGAGSAHGPRLLRLAWGSSGPVVALVGKGITFDSGGISIKPAADMDEMKYDKCGACSVLAIARAVADLEIPVRLRVYAPVAENMLDSRSYRPGDIVRFYNGRTSEITNTDAEGRLILADALSLAAEEGPDVLLEYSTLTGACVVALGHHAAGLFTPDDLLAGQLLAAAQGSGERLWRLPLWPEYLEDMKGVQADLRNSAMRWGAASTAAAFLSQFVGKLAHWAHLDIAGVANVGRDQNGHPGATGYGVALTVNWLRELVG